MRLLFLFIAFHLTFFNQSLIKSEEKVDSQINKIVNIDKKESINENKTESRKIHIVKIGDTISSISKFYSISKDLIIKLNNLKNENYIYVGQNLIISESTEKYSKQSDLINNYHIVQIGENLTEIANTNNLNLEHLIEINNLKNPDSIKVGQKLFLNKNNSVSLKSSEINKKNKNKTLPVLKKQIYGPIIIQSKSYEEIKGKKLLNILNKENKKLILSINCNTSELDVRIPGRKWRGSMPPKEEFEKNLINDLC